MKIYKLVFRIVSSMGNIISESEKYVKNEDLLFIAEEELRLAAFKLGFTKNQIQVIKTTVEVL